MKIALCLLGGGAMGAMYQIGALAALEDTIEAFQANDFDLFLGSSAGASVAAGLAGGQPVQRIYRAFLDPADVYFGLERGHLLRVDIAEWRRTVVSAALALRHGASSLMSGKTTAMPARLSQELNRLYDSLPAGLFTLDGYERFLEAFFIRRGVPNAFAEMPRALRILAHDLDSGEPVAFGAPGFDRATVARACIASMAIPPLFSPVRLGDRHYISSGSAEVAQLELAVNEGADVLVVVRPMVAITAPSAVPTGHGERDSLRDKGMMWVFNQARRIGVQRSVDAAVARIQESSDARVLLLQPQREDGILAMYNPASYDARRGMLEHAYRHTRQALSRAFADRHPALERAGFVPAPFAFDAAAVVRDQAAMSYAKPALLLALALLAAGCKKPYRVGEHVLVEWEKEQPPYPAYITQRVGAARYRVHFDGYDSRWDEDVSLERLLGRVDGPVPVPPPPPKVALAAGVASPKTAGSAGEVAVSPYKEGDRVRVTWRGSVYSAQVIKVVAKDRFEVHYDGHEAAWDEVVGIDRIAGRR